MGFTPLSSGALLGQRVSKQFELGFGFRHVAFYNGNTAADENRFRQQVLGTFGRLSTRFRIDERLHPAGEEVGHPYQTAGALQSAGGR